LSAESAPAFDTPAVAPVRSAKVVSTPSALRCARDQAKDLVMNSPFSVQAGSARLGDGGLILTPGAYLRQ
jgi:hypothetical protein